MISDDSGDEWLNFVPLKKQKMELEFVKSVAKPLKKVVRRSVCKKKEGLPQVKSKNICNFCPSCQLPFNIQVPTSHILECIETDWKNIPECSSGITCNSTNSCHFKQFSHFKLAEYRSVNQKSEKSSLITSKSEKNSSMSPVKTKTEISRDNQQNSSLTNHQSPKSNDENDSSSSSLKENDVFPVKKGLVTSPQKAKTKRKVTLKKETGQHDIRSFLKMKTEEKPTEKTVLPVLPIEEKEKTKWSTEWWKKTDDEKKLVIDETDIPCGKNYSRKCPFYKKIPDTSFSVDAFSYGLIDNVNYYFLSHFHSDHYRGLTGKFKGNVYCSQITAKLVNSQLNVPLNQIHVLSMTSSQVIDHVEVSLIDANHCPGSVMFLFRLQNGRNILHTGDFRANSEMEVNDVFMDVRIDALYLDTTYCHPKYDFPLQDDVIKYSVFLSRQITTESPRTLIICGSYSIGKEKIFKAIAEELKFKVCAHAPKLKLLSMLDDSFLSNVLTRDWNEAQIHVLPMFHLSFNALNEHLHQHGHKFDKLIAFRPTGWEYKGNKTTLENIKPRKSGNISIYGLPYSEHSSFVELRRFVQFVKAGKIIPTVNVGKPEERNRMQRLFEEWMKR